jgi:hypothetical protein
MDCWIDGKRACGTSSVNIPTLHCSITPFFWRLAGCHGLAPVGRMLKLPSG